MKLLYGILEAGNHLFTTYHTHHKQILGIIESTYNLCLISKSKPLKIVGMQIDNILILVDENFAISKEKTIK